MLKFTSHHLKFDACFANHNSSTAVNSDNTIDAYDKDTDDIVASCQSTKYNELLDA